MSHVTIPATGSGDATPQVSTDLVSSAHYQYVKLADGTVGGSSPATVDASGNLRVGIGSVGTGMLVGASVANFPGTQNVSGNVTASVIGQIGASVTNWPYPANVGSVTAVNVGGSVTVYSNGQPLGASISNFPANVGSVFVAGGSITLASSTIQVGVSVANFPVNIGSVTNFMASAYPGVYVGASVANFPANQTVSGNVTASVIGYVGASIPGLPVASVIGDVTNYGGSITLASAVPGIYLGASIANAGAVGAASQVVVGGSITIASAVPGVFVGASISNAGALSAASQILVGGTTTVFIQAGQQVGASVSNFPANQTVTVSGQPISVTGSVVNYGGSVVVASALPGVYVGASVTNFPAVAGASQVVVGGSITVASMVPGLYLGASVANFPANQTVTVSGQPISVSGNVTASVIGYVGASVIPGASVNSFNVGGSIAIMPGASVNAFNVGGSTMAFSTAGPAGIGASPYHFISGASFNNVNIKSSAGNVYGLNAQNVNASPRYLRMFDKATQPSPGTDIPIHTYVIPGNTSGAGIVVERSVPGLHANGIGFDITGGSMGDTDKTVTALGDVVVNFTWS